MKSGKRLLSHIMKKYQLMNHESLCKFIGLDRAVVHRLHYEKVSVSANNILDIYDTCDMTIGEIRELIDEI